jgi:hypothetical protein
MSEDRPRWSSSDAEVAVLESRRAVATFEQSSYAELAAQYPKRIILHCEEIASERLGEERRPLKIAGHVLRSQQALERCRS